MYASERTHLCVSRPLAGDSGDDHRAVAVVVFIAVLAWLSLPARESAAQPDVDIGSSCAEALNLLYVSSPPSSEALSAVDGVCGVYRTLYLDTRSELSAEERALADDQYAHLMSSWALAQVDVGEDCAGALRTLSELAHSLESIPAAAHSAFARASHLALSCPPPPTPPTHGVATLGPGGVPTTLHGIAGGVDDAVARFGGACVGAIPRTPNHTVEIPEAMTVGVAVLAEYDEDLTLVLTGPGGTFCNDDFYGLNPGLTAELTPGQYDVYVGEFAFTGLGAAYEISISDGPLPTLTYGAEPTYGTVVLTPAGAETATGTAGGPMNARVFGASCIGEISEVPNHRLVVSEYGRVTAQVTSLTASDLTLVVTGPGGTFCSNDFVGFDPAISEWMPAGSYDVYVGDRLSLSPGYSIRFSDEDLYAVEVGVLTPQFGTATIGAGDSEVLLAGVAGGLDSAEARFGPHCRGMLGWEPSHTIYLDEDLNIWLEAGGSDEGDLTLVVTGPAGTRCNDDYRGRDPALSGLFEAGTYDIFVGEFSTTLSGTSYGLRIATAEPPLPVESASASVVVGSSEQAFAFWGLTRGLDSASYRFGVDCVGYIPSFPSGVIVLSEPAQVTISAASGPFGDLVMAVSGPDGTYCSDDVDGTNPSISHWFPAGTIEVYVGEYVMSPMGTAFAAEVEATPRLATLTPEPTPPALDEPLHVALGAAPVVHTGTSGGILRGRRFAAECTGYLPERPSFQLELSTSTTVEIAVEAAGDTTLVIDGPGGPFCNDDFDDFNPAVTQRLDAGLYDVYVGSYNPRLRHEFRITFRRTEESPDDSEER